MLWLEANAALPLPKTLGEGEELLVLQGSLSLQTDSDNANTYTSWGWLRFPASSENSSRSTLKSGPEGAQVYRKTGHLTEQALQLEKIQITEDGDE